MPEIILEKISDGKNKRIKCHQCKKKLKMIHYTCKCLNTYCQKHLSGHSHSCTFDYVKEKKELIEKNNPKLGEKFEKI